MMRRLTVYNLLKLVRKWRLLNSFLLVVSFILLCKAINKLKPTTVIVSPLPAPPDSEPVRTMTKTQDLMTRNEAEQILVAEMHEFTVRKKTPIPKIIHQIYRNTSIPLIYTDLIKTWVEKNPEYEYWFWDDETGRKLISTLYPEFLPLYDAYCHDLFRSDALRYFILYEFGGIYIDMDYQCLRSLGDLLDFKHCHVVQEHAPQAQLLYNRDDMILNAWMAAVPYHPFMNFLINNLASRATCKFQEVLKSTGPLFVYDMMKFYYNVTQCNNDICDINVLPHNLMMPEWDSTMMSKKHQMKTCRRLVRLSPTQRKACLFFRRNRFRLPDKINTEAYATHKFLHLGNEAKNYRDEKGYVDIRQLVPKVVFPSDKFNNETSTSKIVKNSTAILIKFLMKELNKLTNKK